MLNFNIAVINETYAKYRDKQVLIQYQTMSSATLECLEALSYLGRDREFSVILFSATSQEEDDEDEAARKMLNQVKMCKQRQDQMFTQKFRQVKSHMNRFLTGQEQIMDTIDDQFDKLMEQEEKNQNSNDNKTEKNLSTPPRQKKKVEYIKVSSTLPETSNQPNPNDKRIDLLEQRLH